MAWISFFFIALQLVAKELPRFLTKHSLESIRFITINGDHAYVQKRPGVLGLVSGFRSIDFLSEDSKSSFLMKDSRFKEKLIIEIVPHAHNQYNLIKNHKIMTVDWGKSKVQEIGLGRSPRLHLGDEWISFYNPTERFITIQNLKTEKKFQIQLRGNVSPFFIPEVEMVTSESVIYTEINDQGLSATILFNLINQKATILYKASQAGTKLELCQHKGYLAIGEFPFDDINRSSKIMQIKLSGSTNLAGYNTIYNSSDADLGNLLCTDGFIYFIKTFSHLKKINHKQTEVVKLDLKNFQLTTMTDLSSVSQLISMDERVLVPFRGDFFVLEGVSNLSDDKLKNPTTQNEDESLEL